jgi:RNA polymerase sigma-70 factor (ECF subfamily)
LTEPLDLALPLTVDTEAEEVRRAKAGDQDVWASWYDRYFPLLFRYVLARLGDRDEAEDIAAQAFLRALEGIGGFRYAGRPVLAWLYRITHNLVADRVRRQKRRPSVSLEKLPPGVAAAGHEGAAELEEALRRLKPEQREVLLLRYRVALSTEEIAAVMGKSESAVYSLHARAVASLRKHMAP